MKSRIEEMTFNTVFSLIQRYGDTTQFPDLNQIKEMLEAHGCEAKRLTESSYLYKFAALMWEQSYQVIMK